jgi:hypothetical protein
MKQFKFFQKERKPMFSGLIERLRTATDTIQGEYRFDRIQVESILPRLEDRVIDNTREYFRNQFEGNFNPNGAHNDIDREVIQMVNEYFNLQPITYKETETLWIEIVRHDVERDSPFSGICHTLNVDVHLRNTPHGRVRYIITKNDGGFIYIREKRMERNERF